MTFTPRIHENGGNCCADYTEDWKPLPPTNPCPKCLEHFAAQPGAALELRTAASTTLTTVEVERRLALQLRRVDDGYMRVVEANVNTGKGTYEARANGKTVTKSFTFDIVDGTTVVLLSPTFAAAEAPDPYAAPLKARRMAAATDASRFEDDYKAARLRDVEATRSALDAEEPPRLLTAEELADYRAPNGYADLLKARAKEHR